jgi:hypothetical protein
VHGIIKLKPEYGFNITDVHSRILGMIMGEEFGIAFFVLLWFYFFVEQERYL